jgi:hypothetical protein
MIATFYSWAALAKNDLPEPLKDHCPIHTVDKRKVEGQSRHRVGQSSFMSVQVMHEKIYMGGELGFLGLTYI